MNIKFDSLNRYETPVLTLCNPGSKYSAGQLSMAIGCLHDTSDEEIIFNFNESSELNFRIYDINHEDSINTTSVYSMIKNRRLVFVDGIGYFVITNVNEQIENETKCKDVSASSVDIEMEQKIIPYVADGTYNFKDLLTSIVSVTPMWSIGYIDSTVSAKYRTFEDVDTETNVLSFFIEDMQDAYECIFIFDIINRIINVYDQGNYINKTDVHLTVDDLISSAEISESSDDIYTAITVFGDNDLIISPINPLGTSTIYNFDYYTDWMSSSLSSKVKTWESLVNSKKSTYRTLNMQYYSKLDEKVNAESDISACEILLSTYQKMRDNIVASGDTNVASEYNEVIEANGGTVVDITKEVSAIKSQIDSCIATENANLATYESNLNTINTAINNYSSSIKAIVDSVSITSYFTSSEYDELSNYIFEGSYTDEYVTKTDSMTNEEVFEQMDTLYNRASSNLEKVSTPTIEYSIDVENFVFSKDFKDWSDEIFTGCLVNVDMNTDEVMMLIVSQITINYEDATLQLTLGNKYNKYDPKSLFTDVLGSVSKSANSLSYVKDVIYPVKNGKITALQEQMQNVRNITMDNALQATNEDVLIDGSGITTRRKNNDGTFDPEQVKITGESIVFTDDSWESCKTALGKLIFNGESKYGLNAEYIYGDIIAGVTANIKNMYASNIAISSSDSTTIQSDLEAIAQQAGGSFHEFHGTSGVSGYVAFATIVITGSYQNAPITMSVSSRNKSTTTIILNFTNSSSSDPTLGNLYVDVSPTYGVPIYIVKTATSTWKLIAAKSEAYDSLQITRYIKPSYMSSTTVTWTDTHLSSLPSEYVEATIGTSIRGYTTINGGCITTGIIDANLITAGTMSADRISGGSIDAKDVTISNLVVGDNVTMGSNARISWNNVDNQPKIPTSTKDLTNDSDYQTSSQCTEITKNTVTTEYINGKHVTASNIEANSTISNTFSCSNINVTGGSINMDSSSETVDKIALNYGNYKLSMCPGSIQIKNGSNCITIMPSSIQIWNADKTKSYSYMNPGQFYVHDPDNVLEAAVINAHGVHCNHSSKVSPGNIIVPHATWTNLASYTTDYAGYYIVVGWGHQPNSGYGETAVCVDLYTTSRLAKVCVYNGGGIVFNADSSNQVVWFGYLNASTTISTRLYQENTSSAGLTFEGYIDVRRIG